MSSVGRSRRPVLCVLAALAVGSGGLAASGAQAASTAATTSAAPGGGGALFSHGAVVDMQRSGFEPGIQIDSQDRLYTSVPYGFSNTQSFLWSSENHGDSYQLIPASVGTGKPQTCVGGGDSELALDARDNLFFSDLQGLTNLSNSVTTDHGRTFTTGCTAAPNTPVDRMWYAVHGVLGQPGFAIYEEYDDVAGGLNPGNPLTNQLVETVSTDGVNFFPVKNANLKDPACLGGGAVNCVTNDEGIPGNQVLSKDGKTLYIAHTSADSNKVSVSIGTLTGSGPATTASWKTVQVNTDLCPDKTGKPGPGEQCGAALFATLAQDTAGNLYVVSAATSHKASTQTSPYSVFLHHSTDGGQHWGTASKASAAGSNAFPWITAGDPGRVDITYYHATEASEAGKFRFDDLVHGSFTVEMSQSLNALSARPAFARTTISEHPVKYGPICTGGLGCTTSGGDRSLGDYLQVGHDARGAAVVAYVDDTSNAFSAGTGPGAATAETGPPEIARQVAGPGLFAAQPTVTGPGAGPARPVDQVSDPTADTFFSANGSKTPAGDNLDLTGAAIADDGHGGVTVTMRVKNLTSLRPALTAGGTTAEWITRFTTYNAGKTPGNGHILYAGMESVLGQPPTFFAGDTKRARLFMTYQQDTPIRGSYTPAGVITLHVPAADLAEAPRATTPAQRTLYSATAFTATTLASLKGNPEGLFNLTDATTPFNHLLATPRPSSTPTTNGRPATGGGQTTGGGAPAGAGAAAGGAGASSSLVQSSSSLPATGLNWALPTAGLAALLIAAAVRRRRT